MAEADFNVIDAVTDVGAVDTEDAMDVEPAQLYEGKPVDSVKADQSWIKRKPVDDQHEDFDKDTPAPGMNSVKAEGEDDVKPPDKSEDDAYHLPDEVWTDLQAINADALAKVKVVKQVRMGGIRMSFIDSVGQGDNVAKRTRASSSGDASPSPPDGDLPSKGAIPPEQQDEHSGLILYLAGTIVNLAERVNVLEAQLREGTTTSASRPNHGTTASASQPREDTLAASLATGAWTNKRKSDK